MAHELDSILKTGQYCFIFNSAPAESVAATVELQYHPVPVSFQSVGSGAVGTEDVDGGSGMTWGGVNVVDQVQQCWNEEKISDFVRKLGFLDAKSEQEVGQGEREDPGEQINRFLHLNQVFCDENFSM